MGKLPGKLRGMLRGMLPGNLRGMVPSQSPLPVQVTTCVVSGDCADLSLYGAVWGW